MFGEYTWTKRGTRSSLKNKEVEKLTFKTGLDFSAIDLRSSRPALQATEVRAVGAGAKAAADPAKREIRASFMVDTLWLTLFLVGAEEIGIMVKHNTHSLS